MPASEIISSYHDLWHVEQSFRMSKTDLRARPVFHYQRDTIDAHLTIVITAKKLVRILRPLQEVTIQIPNGQKITAKPKILDILGH